MIKELIRKNRSYRRFYEEEFLTVDLLHELIDNARLSASAANLQPLRYIVVNNREMNDKVFDTLRWAGYLKDWEGPQPGERPAAYIILLGDKEFSKHHHYDAGIAIQSMLLGAAEQGYGGCIFASVDRDKLSQVLAISEKQEILLVLALGKPKEKVIIQEIDDKEDIKYYRDKNRVHYVPKRKLSDIILHTYS